MHENENGGIAATLAEQFRAFHGFDLQKVEQGETKALFAVVPSGKTVFSLKPLLDSFRALPERRGGTSKAFDLESFVEIVNRFQSEQSAVFANPDRKQPSLVAVFDYHPKGTDATKADWLKHRAEYLPQLSDEWKAWTASNAKAMGQGDFAAFVEERVTDLIVPNLDDPKLKTFADLVDGVWANPSDMVSLSRSLQVNVSSTVKNAQVLSSGEVSIVFEEVHRDGTNAPLKIATLFTIAIPVFFNGDLYRIAARLRYRINNGAITWMYQLVRPELVFDDAFKGIVQKVRDETTSKVFLGSPEQ